MFEVDTLTVGAGGGAYPAAFHLARAGQRVVMIDPKGVMSGNCLAEGCVPSKAVREVAALLRRTQRGTPLGLRGEPPTAAYDAVVAHKDSVQELRYAQHAAELAALTDRLRLLGGWVVGVDAANLIGEIGLAVSAGLTAHQLARFPDQHPMASEGIDKAARRLV